MRKHTIISVLAILLVIAAAGCTSSNTGQNSYQGNNAVSNLPPNFQESNSSDELNKLEPFIDPNLNNLSINSSDPDIKVVRLELIDNRDYKESNNWEIKALLSNDGNKAVYINTILEDPNYASWASVNADPKDGYQILNAGDRLWITMQGKSSLDKLAPLRIISHKTIVPDISPEFKNLKLSIHRNPNSPFADIRSIKYVVTDESRGWKSIIMEISAEDKGANVSLDFGLLHDNNPYGKHGINKSIHPGETKQIEVPLEKNLSSDDLTNIGITFYTPYH